MLGYSTLESTALFGGDFGRSASTSVAACARGARTARENCMEIYGFTARGGKTENSVAH